MLTEDPKWSWHELGAQGGGKDGPHQQKQLVEVPNEKITHMVPAAAWGIIILFHFFQRKMMYLATHPREVIHSQNSYGPYASIDRCPMMSSREGNWFAYRDVT